MVRKDTLSKKITRKGRKVLKGGNGIDGTTFEKPTIPAGELIEPKEQRIYITEFVNKEYHKEAEKSTENVLDILFPNELDPAYFEYDENIIYHDQRFFCEHWDLPENAIVLVIGDVHGTIDGIKNVFCDWQKQKYILPNGTLNERVYVVSLGDLIDYGSSSLNVLYALLKLREINGILKVMLLSGNHEGNTDSHLSGKFKFEEEAKRFFTKKLRSTTQTTSPVVEKKQDDIFSFQFDKDLDQEMRISRQATEHIRALKTRLQKIGPSMLTIRYKNDDAFYYMMHGMYPIWNKTVLPCRTEEAEENPIPIDNLQGVLDEAFWYWPDNVGPGNTLDIIMENTMWNDLSGENLTFPNGRNMKYSLEIGWNVLLQLMQKYRIKCFIRGHQDSCNTQQGFHKKCEKAVVSNVINPTFIKKSVPNNAPPILQHTCKETRTLLPGTTVSPPPFKTKAPSRAPICQNKKGIPIYTIPTTMEEVQKNVFTTSMAYQKEVLGKYGRETFLTSALYGAYIRITPPPPTKGGSRKKSAKGGIPIEYPPSLYAMNPNPVCEKKYTIPTLTPPL